VGTIGSHILIIGATGERFFNTNQSLSWLRHAHHVLGASGLEFCKAALTQGHTLTIYARNPDKLPNEIVNRRGVLVWKGTLNGTLISTVLQRQDQPSSSRSPGR